MTTDIIIVGDFEIHPAAHGGFAVVSPRTGEVVASFATRSEAERAAKDLTRIRAK